MTLLIVSHKIHDLREQFLSSAYMFYRSDSGKPLIGMSAITLSLRIIPHRHSCLKQNSFPEILKLDIIFLPKTTLTV